MSNAHNNAQVECSLGNAHYTDFLLLVWHTEHQLLPQGHFMDRHLFINSIGFFTDFLIDIEQDSRDILTPRKQMTKSALLLVGLKESSQQDCRL